jgi:hypothetical protein
MDDSYKVLTPDKLKQTINSIYQAMTDILLNRLNESEVKI